MSPESILLTGATDGIGRLAARDLAARGHRLLLHGRNPAKLDATIAEIKQQTGNAEISGILADLASLDQVRKLAAGVGESFGPPTILINNAGLGIGAVAEGRRLSADGYELLFAVNYLAPVLLTRLLAPGLKLGARILNVASIGQHVLDFDNLMLEREFGPWRAYRQSKLAMILWSFDLAEELEPRGISVNALHPGTLLATQMVRLSQIQPMGTAQSGADVLVHLALSDEVKGVTGAYFDCMRQARANEQAYDPRARARLRQATDDMLRPFLSESER